MSVLAASIERTCINVWVKDSVIRTGLKQCTFLNQMAFCLLFLLGRVRERFSSQMSEMS